MPFYTPLRYPGGKRRLAPLVVRLLEENGLKNIDYVEPYAGGAAIALALLFEEHASRVHINDLARPVFAFWYMVLNHTEELCRRIERVKITMSEWRRQRAIYEAQETADLGTLGFSALFLNRTNRSGILGGGVIGGKKQTGQWKIDARFNRQELVQRIRKIARYRNRIRLYRSDALSFTTKLLPTLGPNTFTFFDPPYIENGDGLYLNAYNRESHRQLSTSISKSKRPWVVTYDYAAIKMGLYPGHQRIFYGLSYSAQDRYDGVEVVFISKRLKIPETWLRSERIAMSSPKSIYPVFGQLTPPSRMKLDNACSSMYIRPMNRLDSGKRTAVVAALVEGVSIRAASRMTGVSKPTILKLVADLGLACQKLHDEAVRNLRTRRIECDEIWSYVYSKAKNVPASKRGIHGYGDIWTWTALDADSKLIISWAVGDRSAGTAYEFMQDVAGRLTRRVQITTDGHKVYLEAIEGAFGADIDYAMLVKLYGSLPEQEARYSPPQVIGTRVETIAGAPNPAHISTSYVERQNLSMRMGMRRFTRLTNGFSKKLANHEAAIAIYFAHYNFARIHQTLRVTPAMAAGLSDHVWSIEEIVRLLD